MFMSDCIWAAFFWILCKHHADRNIGKSFEIQQKQVGDRNYVREETTASQMSHTHRRPGAAMC